jgi:hypothetical protein
MKKMQLLTILVLLSISTVLHAQKNILEKQFYYGFDEKIEIIRIDEKVLVKTKPSVIKDQYDQAIKKRAVGIKIEWQGDNLCKIGFPSSEIASKIIKELFEDSETVCVRNCYRLIDGFEFGLSDEILVKFKKSVGESERENIMKKFELQKSKSTRMYEKYCLTKDKDIIRVANELYESGLFEFAYPNLISKIEFHGIQNDPYFQFQIALHNTGQIFNGHTGTPTDIYVPEAWDITLGSNNILIAVIDEGNSWGYGSNNPNLHPVIVTAIQYAIANGVVVLFSTGNTASHAHNNNGYMAFLANANVDYLITVDASDRNNQQTNYSPTSSLVDVVAPSHRAYPTGISGKTYEMWSIYMLGNVGYNPYPPGMVNPPPVGEELPNSGTNYLAYTGRFGGTSFSCPQVAGIAALMLSVNPNLTPQQVFNTITSTVEKVGGYSYTGGKSNQMGYGRVNAFLALTRAAGGYGITFNLNGASGTSPSALVVSSGGHVATTMDCSILGVLPFRTPAGVC